MKYTNEQKQVYRITTEAPEYKKDIDQLYLQKYIDDHRPEPEEMYEVFESKINNQ